MSIGRAELSIIAGCVVLALALGASIVYALVRTARGPKGPPDEWS